MDFPKVLLWLGVTLSFSCKYYRVGSQVQSLDNLAAGKKVSQNNCVGTKQQSKSIDVSDIFISIDPGLNKSVLKNEVGIALTAIPQHYVDTFVLAKGSIVITPHASTLCSMNGMKGVAPYEDIVKACLFTVDYEPQTKQEMEAALESDKFSKAQKKNIINHLNGDGNFIVIDSDPSEISHSLIRTMGYMMIADIAKTYNKNGFDRKNFAQLQSRVASAFIADLMESDGLFNLSTIRTFLGTEAVDAIKRNYAKYDHGRKGSFNPLEGYPIHPEYLDRFGEFVSVDAFDSYHCNQDTSPDSFSEKVVKKIRQTKDLSGFNALINTRKTMQEFFPKTYKEYLSMHSYIDRLARTLAQLKPEKGLFSSDGSGFEGKVDSLKLQNRGRGSRANQSSIDARIRSNYRKYVEQKNSSPGWYEKIMHPFETAEARRVRLQRENYRTQAAYLNLNSPKNEKMNTGGYNGKVGTAVKSSWAGASNYVGNVAGAAKGAFMPFVKLGKGINKTAVTTVTQGPGQAWSDLSSAHHHSVTEAGNRMAKSWVATDNSDSYSIVKGVKKGFATVEEAMIIGPGAKFLRTGYELGSSQDFYSKGKLSPSDLNSKEKNMVESGGKFVNGVWMTAVLAPASHKASHAVGTLAKASVARVTAATTAHQGTRQVITPLTIIARNSTPAVKALATATTTTAPAVSEATAFVTKDYVIQPLKHSGASIVPKK